VHIRAHMHGAWVAFITVIYVHLAVMHHNSLAAARVLLVLYVLGPLNVLYVRTYVHVCVCLCVSVCVWETEGLW